VRARWNDALTEPFLLLNPLVAWAWELRKVRGGRLLHVEVSTRDSGQKIARKAIELQRRARGAAGERWLRVRRARLRRVSLHYEANFRIRARGLTVRAYLPAAMAAPCYLPGWTLPVRT
jgi:hypothetical protein